MELNPDRAKSRSAAVVCGSRDWPAPWFVTHKIIDLIPRDWLVITGGAKNALRDRHGDPLSVDQHAHAEAVRLGYATEVIEAGWDVHGRRAGFLRNIVMLDRGPLKVLAFHAHQSKGTAHTIREAYKRGIELHVFTEVDLRPDIAALDCEDEPITLFGDQR